MQAPLESKPHEGRHFPLRECGHAVGFVLLLTALYVGAYYASVERTVVMIGPSEPWHLRVWPYYRFECLTGFFAPVHEFDRSVRPDFWEDQVGALRESVARVERSL